MEPQRPPLRYERPSLGLLLTEGFRGTADLARFLAARGNLKKHAPRGDGHTVIVLPGLLVGNGSTFILRRFLSHCGYRVHGWPLGRNLGLRPGVAPAMERQLKTLAEGGRKVSLIGQSLGGVYARELAREHPDLVRLVISLGSPFGAHPCSTHGWRPYSWVTGHGVGQMLDSFRLAPDPPPVPSTAVYSRRDGVVGWRGALERDCAHCENIEIASSHIGMAAHPGVLAVLMDRLAQPEGEWRPFRAEAWNARFFVNPVLASDRAKEVHHARTEHA